MSLPTCNNCGHIITAQKDHEGRSNAGFCMGCVRIMDNLQQDELSSLRARVATREQVQQLRQACGLKPDDVVVSVNPDGSLLVDGAGGSRRRIWPSSEREERLASQVAALSAALRDACDKCSDCGGDGILEGDWSDGVVKTPCPTCAGWRRALEGQK